MTREEAIKICQKFAEDNKDLEIAEAINSLLTIPITFDQAVKESYKKYPDTWKASAFRDGVLWMTKQVFCDKSCSDIISESLSNN